jgi:predicted Zn-dependent peptidase
MNEPEFYRKKLDNGVIVLFERRNSPVVSVSSSVKFGSQYESSNIKGISHFIEHLVFKGTKKRNVTEIAKEIELRGGIINAFTGEEVTCFWNKLPSKYFEVGADVCRDLVLNPTFEPLALERERKVILEEIKMYHDNPTTFVIEKLKELLYKKPFGLSIAGDSKSDSFLTREKILKIFNSVYSSNNLIFSVVGNTSWENVLDQARLFSSSKSVIKSLPIVKSNGVFMEKRMGIDQAHQVLGFHMPKINDKNRYSAEVFDCILGEGMSSRLFQEIREKRGLCYSIKSNLEQSRDYSYELIYAGTVKEKVQLVKELILKEIKKLKSLNPREFEESKERLIGLKQITKEKCDTTMLDLIEEEIGGNASNYYNYEANISKVKLKDVQNLSKLNGYSFSALIPK